MKIIKRRYLCLDELKNSLDKFISSSNQCSSEFYYIINLNSLCITLNYSNFTIVGKEIYKGSLDLSHKRNHEKNGSSTSHYHYSNYLVDIDSLDTKIIDHPCKCTLYNPPDEDIIFNEIYEFLEYLISDTQ